MNAPNSMPLCPRIKKSDLESVFKQEEKEFLNRKKEPIEIIEGGR